jgi:hypothetical protein
MVKLLATILFLCVIGGGAYYLLFSKTKANVEVTGKIQISKQHTQEIISSSTSDRLFMAVVKGKVKNNTSKPLENIFIKYSIGGQQTSATIFDLAPGQQVEFNTRGVETTASNPEYDYEGVQYDEVTL